MITAAFASVPGTRILNKIPRFQSPFLSLTSMANPATQPGPSSIKSNPKPQFYRRKLPSSCISFSSSQGKQVFKESLDLGHMECYFGLAAQFRTQDEPAFCGLSTLVMVLNTLEIDPKKVWKGPWRWYHENMLDCCVPLEVASQTGVTMDEFACLASCNTLSFKMTRADDVASEEDFRRTVQSSTQLDSEVVVLSYSRRVLGQTGDGHFSPVGGYHPGRDLVLVLDTARFKYPPHWVPLPLIFQAMQAKDSDTGLPRGYFRMKKNENSPLLLFRISPVLSVGHSGQGEEDSRIKEFLADWNSWLSSPGSQCQDGILEAAAMKLVDALNHLDEGDSLLTTQMDIRCPERLSDEHTCVVRSLVKDLESAPIFSKIRASLAENPRLAVIAQKAGEDTLSIKPCLKVVNPCQDASVTNGSNWKMELTASHFLTMLLLAWPAAKCGETKGHHLRRKAVLDLVQMNQELQNEVLQLHEQLDALMGFIEQCTQCSCDRSTACFR